ncbi:hypothetical protein B0H17DRAFT_1094043 [Mycena rosella]|uniref:DUF7918 domain-containing protein n=1 Tax=Mycena rosella TaxID=1033263 RepID=A0AAD7CSI3_MYCRO|nr:hypothetical protein B0H17DRAFT_1094043 [Mycena rosella]
MPLVANGFEACVKIEGKEVQQFQAEATDEPSGRTCWIASELNKGFSIHWKNTDVFCQTAARIWVDGIECAGEIIRGPNFDASVSGRRTSATTTAPFVFSQLDLTDDDAFLDSATHKDVGLIRMEIWTINQIGTKAYTNQAASKESKIHERSKKGVAHQIKFGAEVVEAPRAAAIITYLERTPVVTFTFKYRSIDLLRANGIAPNQNSGTGKRKAADGPSGSLKQETKGQKRVKKEAGSFVPGEIIDLTRSKTPVPSSSEIIDLT